MSSKPSTAEDPPCRGPMHVKYVDIQMSSRWCGVEVRRGWTATAFVAYPHRPMTLHSPTKNSLAVLNHKILEANSQVQNAKLGGHQTCLSINRLWHELCDMLRRLVGTTTPGQRDCSIQE
ncbi:uncharacterized protein TNCV_4964511 [Trichonephila clavipes]|nr:uncharacterized protein TNCV_4964511 [Trichonephila clavipes]